MSIVEDIFDKKKALPKNLKSYGFKKSGDTFVFSKKILDEQFTFKCEVSDGSVSAKLTEEPFGEEFKLHLLSDWQGSFIGGVRDEFEKLLKDIAEKCFENSTFKNPQTIKVIEYIKKKYGDYPEFLWDKFPNFAVFRHSDSLKWYGVVMIISKRKLSIESDDICEVVNLRSTPKEIESITDSKNYFNAYHMNKKYWISVLLNGDIDNKEIFARVSESYQLTQRRQKNGDS